MLVPVVQLLLVGLTSTGTAWWSDKPTDAPCFPKIILLLLHSFYCEQLFEMGNEAVSRTVIGQIMLDNSSHWLILISGPSLAVCVFY